MRVLVISDLYPPVAFGGYELTTATLVEGLRERHDVLVLTSERDRPEPEEGIRRELPYAGPRRSEVLIARHKTRRAVAVTSRVLTEFRPDLVYIASCLAIPHAAALTAASTGLPVVYRLAELFLASFLYRGDRFLRELMPERGIPRRTWGRLMNVGLRIDPRTPHRAAVSWASDALRDRAPLPPWIDVVLARTIYPASDQEEAFAKIERQPAGRRTFLYLGRMTAEKGIDVTYRALAKLDDARLVTVGAATPQMQESLARLASELGVTDRIEHRGRLTTSALAQLLGEIDALILPTTTWDVFPVVLIEAGLARVPIVASRVGGVPEAVSDGEHALLVEPGDASGFAAALTAIFDDPAAAASRADQAYERMRGLSVARYREESERLILDAAAALS